MHAVCYNTASSFNTALVTAKASEQRFSPLGFDGLAATLDAYYEQRCDAVIYDDVILQGDLLERRHSVAEGSASYGRVHKSHAVLLHLRRHTPFDGTPAPDAEAPADAGVPEARDCLKQARDVWDVKYE